MAVVSLTAHVDVYLIMSDGESVWRNKYLQLGGQPGHAHALPHLTVSQQGGGAVITAAMIQW